MYFYNINISDSQDNLTFIRVTSTTSNTALVDLQEVPELQGESTFTLKTNTTVYLSLQVWDYDADSGTDDKIRDIDNLVIPFNDIESNNVWTVKRFTLSDGAYLEIQFQIKQCYGKHTGLGCNFCIENYYTSPCDKYCLPVQGSYTCSTSGDKLCAEHKTGENCDMCQKEWSGEHCEECAENYFPENVCDVTCIAVEGRYTCSNIGKKVCNENWAGAECDNCSEEYFGEFCDVFCKETGHYDCSSTGVKVCFDNTTTVANNCQKFKKNTWVNIGTTTVAVVSTITAVVIIVSVIVLRKCLKEKEQNLARRSNKIANADC